MQLSFSQFIDQLYSDIHLGSQKIQEWLQRSSLSLSFPTLRSEQTLTSDAVEENRRTLSLFLDRISNTLTDNPSPQAEITNHKTRCIYNATTLLAQLYTLLTNCLEAQQRIQENLQPLWPDKIDVDSEYQPSDIDDHFIPITKLLDPKQISTWLDDTLQYERPPVQMQQITAQFDMMLKWHFIASSAIGTALRLTQYRDSLHRQQPSPSRSQRKQSSTPNHALQAYFDKNPLLTSFKRGNETLQNLFNQLHEVNQLIQHTTPLQLQAISRTTEVAYQKAEKIYQQELNSSATIQLLLMYREHLLLALNEVKTTLTFQMYIKPTSPLSAQIETLSSQLFQTMQEIQSESDIKHHIESKCEELKTEKSQLTKQASSCASTMETLQEKITQLETQLNALKKQNDKLQQQKSDLEQLQDKTTEQEQALKTLEQQQETQFQTIADTSQNIIIDQDALSKSTQQLNDIQVQINDMEIAFEAQQVELKSTTAQLTQLEQTRHELTTKQAQSAQDHVWLTQLQQQHSAAMGELASRCENLQQLIQLHSNLHMQLTQQNTALTEIIKCLLSHSGVHNTETMERIINLSLHSTSTSMPIPRLVEAFLPSSPQHPATPSTPSLFIRPASSPNTTASPSHSSARTAASPLPPMSPTSGSTSTSNTFKSK